MSRQYFIEAAKKNAKEPTKGEPVVNRFSDIEAIDKRRHDVLDYLMMGYDVEEIAEYLGVDQSIIQNDAKKIMEMGYKARDEDIEEVRDEIIRTYRMAKKEAFRAFKLSQGETQKVTEEEEAGKAREGDAPGSMYLSSRKTVTELQAGDPRFLNVMIDSAKEMGKVTGAQKHKEFQVQNNLQQNSINILSPNRTKMPNEFNRWTKKPDDKEVPSSENVTSEDL